MVRCYGVYLDPGVSGGRWWQRWPLDPATLGYVRVRIEGKRETTRCLRVVEDGKTVEYSAYSEEADRFVPVTGRHPTVPFSSVLPKNLFKCNASYALGRHGQCSEMFRPPLEDEVGELRRTTCQLLLI